MGRTFIRRLLDALFNSKKGDNTVSRTKNRAATKGKKAKTPHAGPKTGLKQKLDAETDAGAEERFRSSAMEIKNCIDMINKSGKGAPGKSKGGRGRAKGDQKKAHMSAGNRKASHSRNSDKGNKRRKQGVSPAEMVVLLTKAEEKLSEAVVKAKEKDDKNWRGRGKKQI